MSSIVGDEKQEKKISEMGEIAHSLFPEVTATNFKGIFRYSIQDALKQQGAEKWSEISQLNPSARQQFFEELLNRSVSKLKKIGFNDLQLKTLFNRLKKENRKYIS